MSLKYGVLNFLTFLIIVLLAFENYETWTFPIKAIPENETTGKPQAKFENPPPLGSQKENTSLKSYISIVDKNIFSPERKEFPIPVATETKKPTTRPQVVLYGVTMAGDYQAASIANPGRPLRKGERETFTVKTGQSLGEYKLAKILSDRITLEANGDSFDVLLYDPKMPKKRMEMKTESKPKPAVMPGVQPAVATPTQGAPGPIPSSASAEEKKPAEMVQEKTVRPLSIPRVTRESFPSPESRGRRILYPPKGIPTPGTGGK